VEKKWSARVCVGVQNDSCKPIWDFSQVFSIPEAMWLTIATLTTVGLGDVVPTTPWGKMFTGAVMYMGIMVLALPMTVISSNFEGNFRRFRYS
jgi:ABC-type antimicrobial peptide transport system permease subunit